MDNNIAMTTEVESVPEPMPIEEEQTATVKVRKRSTRTQVDKGITVQENDKDKLQQSVDKVVKQMKSSLGLPAALSDMVSQQQLDEWKLKFGELYRTDLNGQSFIWHKVRRKDYIDLMTDAELTAIDNVDIRIFLRQEKITKMCVLYPDVNILDKLIENNAGVAGNISDEIMMISGFKPVSSEQI